ncbi:MAG: hypothetical protein OFPI_31200 [Osedax symbiont Rs2]|nr:MAG: hypothetical protein OFPI_31200 [Osedax symbiont Rs2]
MDKSTESLVLEVDLGNSFAKWRGRATEQILLSEKIPISELQNAGLFSAAQQLKINKVNVCSVANREVEQLLVARAEFLWGVAAEFFSVQRCCAGVLNSYLDPTKMGADRWLATVAAKHLYPDTEICVFDCGTAINVELLSASAVHLGGYIVPGIAMMQQSLLDNTAKVTCSAQQLSIEPGLDTGANVANGSLLLALALLEKLQRQMQCKGGLLLLTGGGAETLADYNKAKNIRYLPDLVLDGFKFI